MSTKKALIVDDSKLAQFVLKKMLVEHDLEVDTTESAEEALEYLTQEKPDVIFLDHTLTGMDGLEALKAIKDDPTTATIPVMMYTSQDDGVYMSQARALGALDILPKQLKPVELAQVLDKLRLTEEYTQPKLFTNESPVKANPPTDQPLVIEQNITSETDELSELVRNAEAALEKESLKQFLKLSLEKQHTQVTGALADIDQRLQEMTELAKGDRRRKGSEGISWLPVLYLTGLALLGVLLYFIFDELRNQPSRSVGNNDQVTQTIVEQIKSPDAPLTEQGVNELRAALEANINSNNQVPFDELLMGERVSQELLNIMDAVSATDFAGTLAITGHTGDFCLATSDAASGDLTLADSSSAFSNCQVIEPLATVDQLSSPELRRFINEINGDSNYKFKVSLEVAGNMQPLASYPDVVPGLKAGEWNQAAQANNRVTFEFIDR